MATTVTSTVITGGGGDYTSLSAWEAGEQRNLVTADEIEKVECSGGADAGGACTINGWTTDSTRYAIVTAASGQEAGSAWNSGIYRADSVSVTQAETKVRDLQFDGRADSSALRVSRPCTVERCFLRNDQSSGTAFIMSAQVGNNVFAINCIGWLSAATDAAVFDSHIGNLYCYNCTAYRTGSGGVGFRHNSGFGSRVLTVKNCIAAGGNTTDFAGTFTSSDYNLSEDATAPGANSVTSGTATFNDAANGDFGQQSTSDGVDVGTDLSGDATFAFSDDIDRATRSGTWDMGASEGVYSVTVSVDVTEAASSGSSVLGPLTISGALASAAVSAASQSAQAVIGAGISEGVGSADGSPGQAAASAAAVSGAASSQQVDGLLFLAAQVVGAAAAAHASTMAALASGSVLGAAGAVSSTTATATAGGAVLGAAGAASSASPTVAAGGTVLGASTAADQAAAIALVSRQIAEAVFAGGSFETDADFGAAQLVVGAAAGASLASVLRAPNEQILGEASAADLLSGTLNLPASVSAAAVAGASLAGALLSLGQIIESAAASAAVVDRVQASGALSSGAASTSTATAGLRASDETSSSAAAAFVAEFALRAGRTLAEGAAGSDVLSATMSILAQVLEPAAAGDSTGAEFVLRGSVSSGSVSTSSVGGLGSVLALVAHGSLAEGTVSGALLGWGTVTEGARSWSEVVLSLPPRPFSAFAQIIRPLDGAAQLVHPLDGAAQLVHPLVAHAQMIHPLQSRARMTRPLNAYARITPGG